VTLDVGALNRAEGGTRNLEAARRYWEWRQMMLDERLGSEHVRRMVRLMREAVRLDPQFVIAWDSLAVSLWNSANYVGDDQPEQAAQLRAEARQAWRRVAELAPDSWIVLCKQSDELLREEKWAESEAVARRILDSGSFSFDRAQPLINVLFATGRINETIELQSQVKALEPRAIFPSRDLQFDLYAGRALRGSRGRVPAQPDARRKPCLADCWHLRACSPSGCRPQALRELLEESVVPGMLSLLGRDGSRSPKPREHAGVLEKLRRRYRRY
jgi:hypothetical protein